MANLLVIGGTGYFGKSILDAYDRGLLKKWNIDTIDIVSRNTEIIKANNPNLIKENIFLHTIDVSECDSLPEADFIIHAAATTDASRYLSAPNEERSNILLSTSNYCKIAKKNHRNSKIIYVSSGAIYGQQPPHVELIPEDFIGGALEEMVFHKRDYAAAKRDSEAQIINLGCEGLSVSIARCFNFIGPFLPRDQHFAIGNFIQDGLSKNKITVKAKHQVIRAYQHSDDLVNWLMTIAETSSQDCPTYNVGSENAIENRNLAMLIAKYFKVEIDVPLIEDNKIDRYVPSTKKAKNELGLNLSICLEEAIDRTVNKINQNRT